MALLAKHTKHTKLILCLHAKKLIYHVINYAKMVILWVNIQVRSPPFWNSVFGTTWLRYSSRLRFRIRSRNPVGPRPVYQVEAQLNSGPGSEYGVSWDFRARKLGCKMAVIKFRNLFTTGKCPFWLRGGLAHLQIRDANPNPVMKQFTFVSISWRQRIISSVCFDSNVIHPATAPDADIQLRNASRLHTCHLCMSQFCLYCLENRCSRRLETIGV